MLGALNNHVVFVLLLLLSALSRSMSQPPCDARAQPTPSVHKVRGHVLRLQLACDGLPEHLAGVLRVQIPAEIELVSRPRSATPSVAASSGVQADAALARDAEGNSRDQGPPAKKPKLEGQDADGSSDVE
eukprot:7279399-Pyramimonas_sp.AAC.1